MITYGDNIKVFTGNSNPALAKDICSSLFISPGTQVYAGMIVGVSPKSDDMSVNVCKKKQLTNMRASGSDEALRLVPPKNLSLEQCLEFLADDELLEVTPTSLRMRKSILDHGLRMKALKGGQK